MDLLLLFIFDFCLSKEKSAEKSREWTTFGQCVRYVGVVQLTSDGMVGVDRLSSVPLGRREQIDCLTGQKSVVTMSLNQ